MTSPTPVLKKDSLILNGDEIASLVLSQKKGIELLSIIRAAAVVKKAAVLYLCIQYENDLNWHILKLNLMKENSITLTQLDTYSSPILPTDDQGFTPTELIKREGASQQSSQTFDNMSLAQYLQNDLPELPEKSQNVTLVHYYLGAPR